MSISMQKTFDNPLCDIRIVMWQCSSVAAYFVYSHELWVQVPVGHPVSEGGLFTFTHQPEVLRPTERNLALNTPASVTSPRPPFSQVPGTV